MYTSVFQCTLFPARTLGLAHSFENTSNSDKKRFSMKIKFFVLIWFFIASTYCQKCKKPKVHYTLYIVYYRIQWETNAQGNVGDSIKDKDSPCHKRVCTAFSKKAAAWLRYPDL